MPSERYNRIALTRELFIESEDFAEVPPPKYFRLKPGGEVRLKYACIVKCHEIVKDASGQVAEIRFKRQPASNHDSDEHPGDVCAICAVMAMANTALFASPPALPLPQAIELSHPATRGESVRVASVRIAFQPRAPPIS